MLRKFILAALALACVSMPAQARHRAQPTACVETGDVMRPVCNGASNGFLTGVKSIRVTMHRERQEVTKIIRKSGLVARRQRQPESLENTTLVDRARSYMPGLVKASTGATARVAASATGAFQCLVDRLEASGYPVRFMGGFRARGSVRGSLHPAGLALDVNQLSRNVTRPAMPSNEIALANGCGLVSGAQWAHGDSGHFQIGGWTGGRHYAGRTHQHYASAP